MLINLKTTLLNLTKLALTNNTKDPMYCRVFFYAQKTHSLCCKNTTKINAKKTPK
jgi:hypothetical protein